jgi:F-type H+-transporting ATPase subunit epsilon
MATGIKVEIVSPERLVLSDTVTSVTVPGTEGYFTVMADHAPFMTTLRRGFVTVVSVTGGNQVFYVVGGFADVSPEGLTILAEEASNYADFSREELQEQIREAEAALTKAQSPEERSYAQEFVNGLLNLAVEAGQLNGVHAN